MSITLVQLKRHVTLAIGGTPSLEEGQTVGDRIAEIINQAGQYLYAQDWDFRERTALNVALVADQAYVDLPADVGEISAIYATERGVLVEMTTASQMEAMRLDDVTDGTAIAYACLTRPQPTPGDALAAPRLELWPTPSEDDATGLSIRYLSGWVDIAGDALDEYIVPVPNYVEALLIQYARAFAIAYEDDGLGPRLMEIDAGPIHNNAKARDGRQTSSLGRLPAQSGTFPAALSTLGSHLGLSAGQSLTIRWRGPFVNGDTYNVGDLVYHDGSTYIASLDPGAASPPSPPWEIFASQGADGQAGTILNITDVASQTDLLAIAAAINSLQLTLFAANGFFDSGVNGLTLA